MDGNGVLETSSSCDLSINEDHSLKDDENIDIDISHDHFNTENHLPLVLGTQYQGNFSIAILILIVIWYLSVSIKMNMTNYDDSSKLILTSSFGTLSSTYATSCDHHKILFKLAKKSDVNILKADIQLPTSAPHKHLDLR